MTQLSLLGNTPEPKRRSPAAGFAHESADAETVEWYTPPWVFMALGIEFDFDPCHPAKRLEWVPAKKVYTKEDDGLAQPWEGNGWLNPPYGDEIVAWLAKMHEHRNGVALVFARTDTDWFHDFAAQADGILFLRRRVRFVMPNGLQGGSPGCGSMLIAWGKHNRDALITANLHHQLGAFADLST